MTEATLVSCDGCGLVFERDNVPKLCCPVCEETAPNKTQVPKLGWARKWWSKL